MAELYWFAFFAKDWLSSPARMAMLPEQRGAYIDLLAIAWGNGDEPPSLPADAASLAALSGLQRRWKTLGPLVRAQFDEVNGRLYNEKLTDVWHEQQARHEQAVKRGRTGGRAKRDKGKTVSSPTVDQLETVSSSTIDGGVDSAYRTGLGTTVEPEPLQGSEVLPVVTPGGTLALEGARAPARLADWRGDAIDADTAQLEAEYFRRLNERADRWAEANADEAADLERSVKSDMGLPHGQALSDFQQRALRETVLVRVREANGWPSSDVWIATERLKLVGETVAA